MRVICGATDGSVFLNVSWPMTVPPKLLPARARRSRTGCGWRPSCRRAAGRRSASASSGRPTRLRRRPRRRRSSRSCTPAGRCRRRRTSGDEAPIDIAAMPLALGDTRRRAAVVEVERDEHDVRALAEHRQARLGAELEVGLGVGGDHLERRPSTPPALLMSLTAIIAPATAGLSKAAMKPVCAVAMPITIGSFARVVRAPASAISARRCNEPAPAIAPIGAVASSAVSSSGGQDLGPGRKADHPEYWLSRFKKGKWTDGRKHEWRAARRAGSSRGGRRRGRPRARSCASCASSAASSLTRVADGDRDLELVPLAGRDRQERPHRRATGAPRPRTTACRSPTCCPTRRTIAPEIVRREHQRRIPSELGPDGL